MQSSKKKTNKDWEEDLYVLYLQQEYDTLMEFKTFINYCKNNPRFEKVIGYTWEEVEK